MKKPISPTTVTVGTLAIVCGLIATYAVRRYLEPPAPVDNRITLVAPRINLPKYARLRDRDVQIIKVDPDKVPEGAITSPERVLFRTARSTILAGQPIVESDLYPVGETPTLAEQLPPGMRAVTFAVDRNNALGGLVLPESYVDISLTVNSNDPRLGGVATKTILERVMVLATSEQRYPSEERLERTFRSVTVAVTPEQVNRLILAQRYGTLSITLRGEQEETVAVAGSDNLVNFDSLLGLEPATSQVTEIWRGVTKSAVDFRNPGSSLNAGVEMMLGESNETSSSQSGTQTARLDAQVIEVAPGA
jgi:pilus assembly protein CpaB